MDQEQESVEPREKSTCATFCGKSWKHLLARTWSLGMSGLPMFCCPFVLNVYGRGQCQYGDISIHFGFFTLTEVFDIGESGELSGWSFAFQQFG